MNRVAKVDVVLIEEFTEAVLVDFIPELCLRFCERSGMDDNLFWTACFVVAHAADQVESEECAVEEAMWEMSHMDSSARESQFLDEFHFIVESVTESNFRIFPVEGIRVENEGLVGFHRHIVVEK